MITKLSVLAMAQNLSLNRPGEGCSLAEDSWRKQQRQKGEEGLNLKTCASMSVEGFTENELYGCRNSCALDA